MQSRMDRYYNKVDDAENIEVGEDLELTSTSRINRNQTLYKEVSNRELEEFDLNSNVSVIGDGNNVDIDKIREMLDRKYRELPKNKSIGKAEPELGKINLDETREYDLNSILEKARESKEINYEEDRLKKLRNTQYDILKSLDIVLDNEDEEIEESEVKKIQEKNSNREMEEKKLQDLINTITAKELLTKEDLTSDLDPLDILSDLRGDDENTRVLGALSEENLLEDKDIKKSDTLSIEIEDDEEEKPLEIKPLEVDVKVSVNNVKTKVEKKDNRETNTFQDDFDDFNDLKEDMKFTKVLVKILIFVLIVLLLIGCVVVANKLLGLGLF